MPCSMISRPTAKADCSSPIAPEGEKAEITDVTTCRNDMVTCESPLSVRFHELGPLPTPPNPPPNPYSHLSGPVCNRVMVIMFLCAWRLPSFRPRPCASHGSRNQHTAGMCQWSTGETSADERDALACNLLFLDCTCLPPRRISCALNVVCLCQLLACGRAPYHTLPRSRLLRARRRPVRATC